MEVKSGHEFVSQVAEWAPSMKPSVAKVLMENPIMLDQFWGIASSIEKMFFESTALQLGFGLCEPSQAHQVLSQADKLRKDAAIKVKAPKRAKIAPEEQVSATPLLDQENAQRHMWATKLEEIGRRAGQWSKLLTDQTESSTLTPTESAKLRQLVLTCGAPRTMAAQIRAWEKFELWAAVHSLELYPLTVEKLLKYCLELDAQECGPSVIPAFRTAARWVTSRLAIECPDLDDHQLLALQQEVITKRAKTLKEAIPIPIEVVKCLERFVVLASPVQSQLFVWWWLCMIFASLRFDDAVHVKPSELQLLDDGLFGVAWQTKVERKRRGTRFVVPRVGFSQEPWLEKGWELFQASDHQRDFWIPELNSREQFLAAPPSYQRSLQWLKVFCREALQKYSTLANDQQLREHATEINKLTAHSARVTLLDAAVHAGRSTEEIGLQANWKNPGPLVLKYTRNRSSVPALMVQQLVRDMTRSEHPVQEAPDVIFDDPEEKMLQSDQFFLKQPAPGTYYDYRFHCSQLEDPDKVACNKFSLSDCIPMGNQLPDLSVFCKACARARPDVVRAYESKASGSSSVDGA